MATPTATFKPALTRSAFDNLLRRELNVSNPNDPEQVAQALLKRYGTDPRARSLRNEVLGLATTAALPAADGGGALIVPTTMRDLSIAQADLEQDFSALLASPLTKDIRPELEGWQGAIEDLMQQGLRAARQSVDLLNRDRMFASRRRLSEYARLSRLVGALTPELEAQYRNLAFSIDEVRAVIFVLAGEALADADVGGEGFIVKVGRPELELRREAVLSSLRALTGVLDDERDVNATPIGLVAYAEMVNQLDALGDGELRALANEGDMAQLLDGVLDEVDGADPSRAARRLGATSWGPLQTVARFRVAIDNFTYTLPPPASSATAPNPAPIDSLVKALGLFDAAFGQAGGGRLKAAARPAILSGSVAGSTIDSTGVAHLLNLINLRAVLQQRADQFVWRASSPDPLRDRVLIDACLYFADSAIDRHASGPDSSGVTDRMALSYAVLIDGCRAASWVPSTSGAQVRSSLPDETDQFAKALVDAAQAAQAWTITRPTDPTTNGYGYSSSAGASLPFKAPIQADVDDAAAADERWKASVAQMARLDTRLDKVFDEVLAITNRTNSTVRPAYDFAKKTLA